MAKLLTAFFVAFAIQATLAAPVEDANKNLEQLGQQLQTTSKNIADSLSKLIPDEKTLTAQTQDLKKHFEEVATKLQAEINKNEGASKKYAEELLVKVNESIDGLKKLTGPEGTKKVTEFKKELEAGFKDFGTKFETWSKDVQPQLEQAGESVKTFFSDVFNNVLDATKTFNTNVQGSIKQN